MAFRLRPVFFSGCWTPPPRWMLENYKRWFDQSSVILLPIPPNGWLYFFSPWEVHFPLTPTMLSKLIATYKFTKSIFHYKMRWSFITSIVIYFSPILSLSNCLLSVSKF
jgi:hypothetical protein